MHTSDWNLEVRGTVRNQYSLKADTRETLIDAVEFDAIAKV